MLTGKAKKDFTKYFWNKVDFSHKLNTVDRWYESFQNHTEQSHQYASIIDWLDSVGIYLNIDSTFGEFTWSLENEDERSVEWECATNRQEATKAAIQQANSIYNSRDHEQG